MNRKENVVVRARDLQNALRNTIRFTDPLATGGVTGSINFVIRRNRFVAEATDRSRYIQVSISDIGQKALDWPEEYWFGSFPAARLSEVEKALRPLKKSASLVNMVFRKRSDHTNALTVEVSHSEAGTEAFHIEASKAGFPDLDHFLPKEPVDEIEPSKVVDPFLFRSLGYIYDVRSVRSIQDVRLLTSAPGAPFLIQWRTDGVGWAQGVLMPRFVESDENRHAVDWF